MPKLDINAPDGKILTVDVPEGTDPSKYDSIVDEVVADYTQKNPPPPQGPGVLKSAALGAMSGIPGAETVVSGIEALSPNTTYAQAHQGLEEGKNAAWETHPVAYGAGKTAGIVGTGLAAPVTETLGGAVALGAGIGGLSGIDTAETPTQAAEAGVKGAGMGAVLGGLGHGISKGIQALPGMAKRGLAALGKETTTEDIERYLANPDVVNSALSKEGLANKAAELTGDVTKASSQLSEGARGMLSKENPLDIKDLKNVAMDSVQKYFTEGNPATAADELSVKTIVDQYQKLAQIAEGNGGKVPETTLRSMIDRIQAATKDSTYGNPEASASQRALKEFGGKLNDLLRESNPAYAEAMAPSAEAAKLSSGLQDTFKLENLQPSNATATKVSNLLKEGKPEEQSLAEQLKNLTGTDLIEMIKNSQTKENLNAPGSGEAMKALLATLGFGAGKMTGVPYGGIAGAAAGRFSANAVNGGGLAKTLMNMYLSGSEKFSNTALKPLMAKYGPILINAAKQGGNQLAATHFVLATSNPEYQQLAEHAANNPETEENTGIVNQE